MTREAFDAKHERAHAQIQANFKDALKEPTKARAEADAALAAGKMTQEKYREITDKAKAEIDDALDKRQEALTAWYGQKPLQVDVGKLKKMANKENELFILIQERLKTITGTPEEQAAKRAELLEIQKDITGKSPKPAPAGGAA